MYQDRMDDRYYREYKRRSSSVFGRILRFIIYLAIGIAVLSSGLWILGAALGLVVGLFVLAVALAPIFIVGWLVCVFISALLF